MTLGSKEEWQKEAWDLMLGIWIWNFTQWSSSPEMPSSVYMLLCFWRSWLICQYLGSCSVMVRMQKCYVGGQWMILRKRSKALGCSTRILMVESLSSPKSYFCLDSASPKMCCLSQPTQLYWEKPTISYEKREHISVFQLKFSLFLHHRGKDFSNSTCSNDLLRVDY